MKNKKCLSESDVLELARAERDIDDIAQCGVISRLFPEIASAILEAKRPLADIIESNGVEVGSVY